MSSPNARDLALGLALGMIDSGAAIEWADRWIMLLEDPPYWLIEISTARQTSSHDLLKLVPESAFTDEPSDAEFLAAMAVRLIDRGEPLVDLLPLLMDRFCFCEWTEMTEVRKRVYLIEDEMDWDFSRAKLTAAELLHEHVDEGRRLLERIQSQQAAAPNHSLTPVPKSGIPLRGSEG